MVYIATLKVNQKVLLKRVKLLLVITKDEIVAVINITSKTVIVKTREIKSMTISKITVLLWRRSTNDSLTVLGDALK